ncbi:MAG: twin-arginine translocase subunit TatC [Alphaproteobacteria bacterium]|nr:MAG: twin-arginine translocase subunit TatC [Alphaproteobacteria bacterium]
MPLMDHLVELRNRLVWSLLALLIGFGFCYYFAAEVYKILMQPLISAFGSVEGRRMIFTNPTEAFFTYLKIAFWGGIMLSFPVISTQLYMFVAPGLYKNERRAFLPFLLATPVLFTLGAALNYFFIMPLALRFFLSFEAPGGEGALPIELETKISDYLNLIMLLTFAFGLSFQLPVLLTLLGRVGLISSSGLRSKRKFAIVGVFIFAAIITPPDVISQVGLALPMILLYELSIFAVRAIEKKRDSEDEGDTS